MTRKVKGWLLDFFPKDRDGFVLWLITEDNQRARFKMSLPAELYISASVETLQQVTTFIAKQPEKTSCAMEMRRDLFQPDLIPVLAVRFANGSELQGLFWRLSRQFPSLDYYNADIHPALRLNAAFGAYPQCLCEITVNEHDQVTDFVTLDSPFQLELPAAPVRTLSMEPDRSPNRGMPEHLWLQYGTHQVRLALSHPKSSLHSLRSILLTYDPDLILTAWGDGWMLEYLAQLAEEQHVSLPWNREPGIEPEYRQARSYFAYNQMVFRDQQVHLFGRWHVDIHNATLYHDYGMKGIYESARISGLPIQTVARTSPGSGISAMQVTTALRNEIMVPWHKQEAENFKSVNELIQADQGGLVYQPESGLHFNIAELDFISMYPSIMVYCNISPETTPRFCGGTKPLSESEMGLIPKTLKGLLEKRVAIKHRLKELSPYDRTCQELKAQSSAHKWLLVTCFGYLGYKNARFGRIEAHETVNAFGREALLRAKEAAEDMGYEVLHMYVDGLWVRHPQRITTENLKPLLDEIEFRSGLPLGLDGIYNWVAFLPSRIDEQVSVANRYFGIFEDGSVKVRGIELRRRDAPGWIAGIQTRLLEIYCQVHSRADVRECNQRVISYLKEEADKLKQGEVPLSELVVSTKLSRTTKEYVSPSPAAQAAMQLEKLGKSCQPGQVMRYLFLTGNPRIHAWDLPEFPAPHRIDQNEYFKLMFRAASSITLPFGLSEADLGKAVIQARIPVKKSIRGRLLAGNRLLPLGAGIKTKKLTQGEPASND